MLSSDMILMRISQQLNKQILDATTLVLPPPPVRGVGRAGGFVIMIEDRGDLGPAKLQAETANVVAKANMAGGKSWSRRRHFGRTCHSCGSSPTFANAWTRACR